MGHSRWYILKPNHFHMDEEDDRSLWKLQILYYNYFCEIKYIKQDFNIAGTFTDWSYNFSDWVYFFHQIYFNFI